eukprot:GILK01001769.1.p1 GENE.GILK01001769.1~~GILK01001769.1.p1  ORF type:complete len:502 (-),score=67.21 GILK01001769.1:196-1587(-)
MANTITEPLDWRFTQVFGEKTATEEITEADILSAIEFDHTGDYLAVGDRGGRIIIFQRVADEKPRSRSGSAGRDPYEYRYFTEFQSHEPEFDYLKSLEIEEKINKIRWCKQPQSGLYMLSTNDKTVKLWKVYEKKVKVMSQMNLAGSASSVAQLRVPRVTQAESVITAVPRRVYANAHAYHINSISLGSDGENFISTDDLRVNLWNLERSDQTFNIVDIKPPNMEELTEVITSAEFHPHDSHIFMYSSSRGAIKMADLRQSALCDRHAKLFEEPEDPAQKSFFSEIVASISDVKFTADGRYILARDYLTLKVWDINMDSKPVKTIQVHEHLRTKLCDLYESESIFDKFEISPSPCGNWIMTGSYNNSFHVLDRFGKTNLPIEASKGPVKRKTIPTPKAASPASRVRSASKPGSPKGRNDVNDPSMAMAENIDINKKILHGAWHPTEHCVAVAGLNCLYIYNAV